MEDDFVRGLAQKGGARDHRLQDAAFVLNAKVTSDAGDLGDVAHQALGAVCVQVIDHDVPLLGAGIALDCTANVGQEVCFVAGRSYGWADDFTSDDIEVDDE